MKKYFLPITVLAVLTLACSLTSRNLPAGSPSHPAPTRPHPARPSQPASAEIVSTVQVFLAALGGGGDSGDVIGCGDSLVPITLMVEPTEGALRASLTHLLALREQHLGESGLYNALYLSDLRVDEISVNNGAAEIRLSGSLLSGGACDGPRIIGQLSATALQFDDISVARFFVNGLPLEEVLSGK